MSTHITRCQYGIPTLTASDEFALAYAQGVVTAQDRAWQISVDTWRLSAQAATYLGASHSELDDLISRVDLLQIAKDCFQRASPRAQRFASSYADGINSELAAALQHDPIAKAANLAKDAPSWEPWTPVALMLLAHLLFGAFPETLWREHVRRTLGEDAALLMLTDPLIGSGSNAWYVPAALTADNFPLICADPHRLLECPGPYQQIRFRAPGIYADGLAFPGFPGIPHFGQTANTAWAVTNAMADSQPLIRVTDATSRPIVATDATGPLALAWSPMFTGDGGLQTSLDLLSVSSSRQVITAFSHWIDPVDDVITADIDQNAFRFTAGKVPFMAEEARLWASDESDLPASLCDSFENMTARWEVFPIESLTVCTASANEYKSSQRRLGYTYCPPQRAQRITALLNEVTSAGSVDVTTAANIALDCFDAATLNLVQQTLKDINSQPTRLPDKIAAFATQLLSWDGFFSANSTIAMHVAQWRHELVKLISKEPFFTPLFLASELPSLYSPWVNPVARIGFALDSIVTNASYFNLAVNDLAIQALNNTLESISIADDITWGDNHLAYPLITLPDSLLSQESNFAPTRVSVGGDTSCVLSTGSIPGVTNFCLRAPVARVTWKVGAPESSQWVIPWGSQGNCNSPNYNDQTQFWADGKLLNVNPKSI
ncbi:MAG: penicillin acylase family protein [Propionibacteriaceae bacterium]